MKTKDEANELFLKSKKEYSHKRSKLGTLYGLFNIESYFVPKV